ncbi:glucosylceramidase, putative [Ixodes scapularis]|uniref:Glucosylceramidase n=1 Tax=Ixodes scapularis TaxID=6945 RepID=B7PJE6_IXOSC|nr:glucosylceramidase, putative [Ixodes scapularis]|eukprot:XP_002407777.1 glucosylceramidase, putative [Ixodes scapularis]
MSKGDVWIFGSPWSGPAWMKTSGRLHGAGQLKGRPGGPYYEAWAKYIVRCSGGPRGGQVRSGRCRALVRQRLHGAMGPGQDAQQLSR